MFLNVLSDGSLFVIFCNISGGISNLWREGRLGVRKRGKREEREKRGGKREPGRQKRGREKSRHTS